MMERLKNIDVGLIYALWNEVAAACRSGELERWIALWKDDGIQLPPDAPPRVGKEQIRAAMYPTFDRFDTSDLTIHMEEVRVLGDRAYSHGTYTFDLTPKGGGKTKTLSGKFLDILEKQMDGSWKIAIDCHNYNTSIK